MTRFAVRSDQRLRPSAVSLLICYWNAFESRGDHATRSSLPSSLTMYETKSWMSRRCTFCDEELIVTSKRKYC